MFRPQHDDRRNHEEYWGKERDQQEISVFCRVCVHDVLPLEVHVRSVHEEVAKNVHQRVVDQIAPREVSCVVHSVATEEYLPVGVRTF